MKNPQTSLASKPECLIFDLGKVMIDFSVEKACQQIARVANTSDKDVFAFLFTDGHENRFETGEIEFSDLHRMFEERMNRDIDINALEHACGDIFTPIDASLHLVRHLRDHANIPMILLSNTNSVHWNFINKKWAIHELFHHHVLSFQVKSMKPHIKIYEEALRLARVPAATCFFTDDLSANVAAAKALGIDAVQFLSTEQLQKELLSRGLSC